MDNYAEKNGIGQAILRVLNEKKPKSVQQLARLVEQEVLVGEEEILEAIMRLQSQAIIRLENRNSPKSIRLAAYSKTSNALWFWAVVGLATATLAAVFAISESFFPWSLARNVLGLVFTLWLPGYAMTKALFPLQVPRKTSNENLETIERAALSIGLSLATVPMIGLILYYTPFGIGLTSVAPSIFALTILLAVLALAREQKAHRTQATVIQKGGL